MRGLSVEDMKKESPPDLCKNCMPRIMGYIRDSLTANRYINLAEQIETLDKVKQKQPTAPKPADHFNCFSLIQL
jgi:hypothetical protein